MKVLGIIPARAGSTRLPHKNRHTLGVGTGALWEIAARQAKQAGCDRVVVSTNDSEILRSKHAEPWMHMEKRPESLATDKSPIEDTVHYVLKHNKRFDAVCVLNPTHPLRQIDDIRECIRDVTLRDFPSAALGWKDYSYTLAEGAALRSLNAQDRIPRLIVSGECYVVRTVAFLEFNSLMIYGRINKGYLRLSNGPRIDVDEWDDLLCARAIHRDRKERSEAI